MKKAITPILTGIFALGTAFGASGCSDVPQEEPPKQDPQPQRTLNLYSYDEKNSFTYLYEHEIGQSNAKRFYLLNIDAQATSYGHPTSITLYGDKSSDENSQYYNIAATELANIYVNEFGSGMQADGDTGIYRYTFSMNLHFKLLSDDYVKGNNFSIELSDYAESSNLNYRLKIFEESVLIAEGTYEQTVEVSKDWLISYIKQNLI